MGGASTSQVQRGRPFGRLRPRQVWPLPLERVRPLIRIAHRAQGHLEITERIIFDYELVLFLAGQGSIRFGSQEQRFGPHDLFCIPPFVPHAIRTVPGENCGHLAVHFDWARGVPAGGRLPERRPYEVRLPGGRVLPRQVHLMAHDRLEQQLHQLVEAHTSGSALGALEATGCLLLVLTMLLRRNQDSRPTQAARDQARLEQAIEQLRAPATPACRPAALAQAVGLSVSHFNRLFREWTGFAPVEYQRRQRVSRARELLADPRLSIKQIAAQCGFDDPYHFSRVFRQVDGLSPSQYREARLAGQKRPRPV